MSSLPLRLIPINRHIVIVPNFSKKEEEPGILLPDDYKPQESRYISATIVDASKDCSLSFKTKAKHSEIIVDRSMIEEIVYREKSYYVILENYVVGFLEHFSEPKI